ncbi:MULTISPECIES: ABC transporter permease [unclassified Lacrimispora]|uniref:ABC transporter permease n=1 Tax=unclassified Lacrimispora TaxID=2719232 RepID=UPI0037703B42
MKLITELYTYREMIFSLVRRDLKGRYKGSALGFLWTFLNPLLQLGVYTLVFSVIMRNGIKDYYLFLFVALIPWIFFSTCVSGGATCIMTQKEMVKKIYFPRQVLPLAFVTSQFVNMLLSFLVVIPILLISGKGIDLLALTYLPLIMIIEYVLALGMAMLVSAITVYLRDTEYILGIVTMAWQFLSPVIYSIDQVPEKIRPLFLLNPMTSILTAYRDILYYKQVPQVVTLLNAVALGGGLMLISLFVFDKLSRHFAEEL